MRHILGTCGVLASLTLLAVSAAMNWRFGYSLGKTEFDGYIYGAASVAADCLKALAPFFFFAAVRNRNFPQAVAAGAVWGVVTLYALTSALGHAALNRLDTTGERAAAAASYGDIRADVAQARQQLSWVPKHRPAAAVEADLARLKTSRLWQSTNECLDVNSGGDRRFCSGYRELQSELANAQQAAVLETKIAALEAKLGGSKASSEADPQAAVISRLSGVPVPDVQTALTVFVALLLEIGSGFGLYVSTSQWRQHEIREAVPRGSPLTPVVEIIADASSPAVQPLAARAPAPSLAQSETKRLQAPKPAPEQPKPQKQPKQQSQKPTPMPEKTAPARQLSRPALVVDNTEPRQTAAASGPASVEAWARQRLVSENGSYVKRIAAYADYRSWASAHGQQPLRDTEFFEGMKKSGYEAQKQGRDLCYLGVSLAPRSVANG